MKILLDTHILLWKLTESPKLPDKANKVLSNPENSIFYSVVSLWEVAIKYMMTPPKIDVSPAQLISYCREMKFNELVLNAGHVLTLETLTRPEDAPPHKDPFDRMLISQAKAENMIFLTHDALIPYYNEHCIMYV